VKAKEESLQLVHKEWDLHEISILEGHVDLHSSHCAVRLVG